MKKIALGSVLVMALLSCNNNTNDNATTSNDSTVNSNSTAVDSLSDTTLHPTGITTDAVISTDTAAMKVHTTKTEKHK